MKTKRIATYSTDDRTESAAKKLRAELSTSKSELIRRLIREEFARVFAARRQQRTGS